MKIGFLMHGIGWGGAAGSLMLLLKSISKLDAEKHFITSIDRDNPARNEFIKYTDSYKVIPLPQLLNHAADGKTPLKEFREIINGNYAELINYLKALRLDILHINSSVFAYLLKVIKKELDIKIITHVRETFPLYDDGSVRKFMIENIEHYSDKIICISENEAEYFRNCDKVIILANPFDFTDCDHIKQNYKRENNISDDTILVGMAGQLSKSKGHLLFLKAIDYLVKNKSYKSNVVYLIFGLSRSTPIWKSLIKNLLGIYDINIQYKKYLRENNLGQYVHSLPYLYKDEYFNILSEIDIYVRPSLAGDPWGRDIIEAMAFGKPIVATGSSQFFIKEGINGFLVQPNNHIALANYIDSLIRDKKLRNEFGRQNIQKIKDMCDLENYGKSFEKIIMELCTTN